jgi:hypothetical protein
MSLKSILTLFFLFQTLKQKTFQVASAPNSACLLFPCIHDTNDHKLSHKTGQLYDNGGPLANYDLKAPCLILFKEKDLKFYTNAKCVYINTEKKEMKSLKNTLSKNYLGSQFYDAGVKGYMSKN